jgi:hypothetical protein
VFRVPIILYFTEGVICKFMYRCIFVSIKLNFFSSFNWSFYLVIRPRFSFWSSLQYKLRLYSNKWANQFLISLKVSKIDRYANCTINAMVCNISTNLVFFVNNNTAEKMVKKNCKYSRKNVCHFAEKIYMRIFLGIEYKIEKN